MNKKIKIFYILLGLLFNHYAFSVNYQESINSKITVTSVHVWETDNQTFTTQFDMNINEQAVNNWQLGFFSFRFFYDPNANIKMQICEQNNLINCADLKTDRNPQIEKYSDFKRPDLTAGYFTVLTPILNYPLNKNRSYRVVLQGAKWPPQNISAMPQGFFLYDIDNKIMNPIDVHDYVNLSFDPVKVEIDLKNHIYQNWKNSLPNFDNENFIIPNPAFVQKYPNEKKVNFKDIKKIYYNNFNNFQVAKMIKKSLIQDLNLENIDIVNKYSDSGIQFISCDQNEKCEDIQNKKEGYIIDILSNKNNIILIKIYSNSTAGSFYAYETLRQIWNANTMISSQKIIDYPKFSYRGFSLDVARHFFTVNEIKSVLDVMASHKLNTLHWHLSDDEGWRIEVDDFPELTNVGSQRFWGYEIAPNYLIDGKFDIANISHANYALANDNYKGYYSKLDVQEIIKYANQRQITVIPEIEMPGHARSLMKSSPEKFADPDDKSVYFGVQGYTDNVLPLCQYTTNEEFKKNINLLIQNIANQFKNQTTIYANSNEISLSGDEVAVNALSNYPACAHYPWNQLNSALEKTHYFFQQIAENLSPEIKLSGWQQIVQKDEGLIGKQVIAPEKMGHTWVWIPAASQGIQMAENLIQNHYPTVIAFADYAYFDIAYTTQWQEAGLLWATTFLDTHKTLLLGNKIQQISNYQQILGLEGALWTEVVPSTDHLMYMILPKMAGLSEAAWSSIENNGDKINWQNLAQRLGDGKKGFLSYLNKIYGVFYRGYPNGIHLEVPKNAITK
ncbi:family 20 glycosylhydrolase [Silvanigrella aquatica]|uniref:beta-N-acetylhexosaminidase n=1 Tax=Silvanigrella aquatica TaxID=1915309 RepID=A0A1L4D206_9BACT|nr:family 20 glycosylhydrolase [Silvanigrella aquatica]APJ04224.1 hypothetical protein AXG55_10025 [Silvanigrella aquatica]